MDQRGIKEKEETSKDRLWMEEEEVLFLLHFYRSEERKEPPEVRDSPNVFLYKKGKSNIGSLLNIYGFRGKFCWPCVVNFILAADEGKKDG